VPVAGLAWWLLQPRLPELAKPSRLVPLSALPRREIFPRFSPDGKRIAFCWEDEAGRFRIYLRDVEGGTQTAVSEQDSLFPAWSPDGQTIAFLQGPAVMLARMGD